MHKERRRNTRSTDIQCTETRILAPSLEGSPSTLRLLAHPSRRDAATVPEGPWGRCPRGPAGLPAGSAPLALPPTDRVPGGRFPPAKEPLRPFLRGRRGAGTGVPSGFGGGGGMRAEGGAPSPRPDRPRTYPPAVG